MTESSSKIKHKELSYRIVGCAQRVHRELGPGFPETVYHKALCYELMDEEIPFESEEEVEVHYAGRFCGQFRADVLVDGKVVVELKALNRLNDEHVAQVISYLKAVHMDLGILINFGCTSLETRRVVY